MKLEEFLDWLMARRRIDLLLLMYEFGEVGWNLVKKEMDKRGRHISDGTYRLAVKSLVKLGLAMPIAIDPLKFKYQLTDQGCLVASVVNAMVNDIRILLAEKVMVATLSSNRQLVT